MMSYGRLRLVSYSYAAGATTVSAKSRTSSRRRRCSSVSSKPATSVSAGRSICMVMRFLSLICRLSWGLSLCGGRGCRGRVRRLRRGGLGRYVGGGAGGGGGGGVVRLPPGGGLGEPPPGAPG